MYVCGRLQASRKFAELTRSARTSEVFERHTVFRTTKCSSVIQFSSMFKPWLNNKDTTGDDHSNSRIQRLCKNGGSTVSINVVVWMQLGISMITTLESWNVKYIVMFTGIFFRWFCDETYVVSCVGQHFMLSRTCTLLICVFGNIRILKSVLGLYALIIL